MSSFLKFSRVLKLAAVLSVFGTGIACAEEKLATHPGHAIADGVRSLDVYAEGSRLHLLTGESAQGSERPALLHRHSEDSGATWSQPVQVDKAMPAAFSLHRGMDAQIAAAGDHLVALWMTAGTDQWGSGPMATALSEDGGRSWRTGPNPADDSATTGHGFFDIAAEGTGAFHLTWLDSRDGKQGLRYAHSNNGGKSWSANLTVKAATCECCPNTIAAGADGKVAILFRDGNPRDMRLVCSEDGGRHWPVSIAAGGFDWQFNGCPHVGGGLALVGKGAGAVFHAMTWTGKAEHAGIYHIAFSRNGQPASEPKRLGEATASHPDLAADAQGRLAAVWDSRADETSSIWGSVSTDAGQSWSAPRRLSMAAATHPRIVATGKKFRVFWTEERAENPTIIWASALLP